MPSRPRLVLIGAAASLLMLGLASSSAAAAQRFASPTGAGTTCTQASPCPLNTAITGASAGDEVILISNGTSYALGTSSILVPAGVEVHGEDGQPRPLIEASAGSAPLNPGGANVRLRHLNIQNTGPAVNVSFGAVVRDVRAVSSNAGTWACLFGTSGTLTDALCIATSPTNSAGTGTNFGNAINVTLRNVTAVGGANGLSFGVSADSAPSTVDAKNVIAIGPVDVRAFASTPSSIAINMAHSNYDTTAATGTGSATVTTAGTGSNQTAAPAFVNAAAGDYRQASGSPTIDAGTLDPQNGPVDLDGESRDQGLVPDIGADEFTNSPPTASSDSVTVAEDAAATAVNPLANDVDSDGAGPVIRSVTQPPNGTVSITGAGTGGGTGLTYEPDPDYCNDGGPADQFVYTLNGGSQGTVSATVTCVADAPVAVDDSVTVGEDAPSAALGVTGNDTDADGDPVTVSTITPPTPPDHGTVTIAAGGGDVQYEPDLDYCGADAFDYTVNGGNTATVAITVTCVDDPPTAVDDSVTVDEDAPLAVIDALGNDDDPDGGALVVTSTTDPAHGTAAASPGGDAQYQPDADYCGADTFDYTVNGGDTGTVSVSVTCIDDLPVAVGDAATLPEGAGPTPINVLANDTDVDGGAKAVASTTAPGHGTAAVAAGGTGVTYQPASGFCGPDSFSYALNGGSSAAVSITVPCVAPGTSFRRKPAKVTRSRRAKFRFASTEAGSTFRCKLDRKPFRPCPPSKTFVVKPGRHTLRVRAIDAAGNADQTPAIFRWRVLRPR